jgi:hypothetical protein
MTRGGKRGENEKEGGMSKKFRIEEKAVKKVEETFWARYHVVSSSGSKFCVLMRR